MPHACHRFWRCYKTLTFCSTFGKVQNPMRLPGKTTSEPSKSGPSMFFYILTWKCASRHNGVHSFDITTSKKCSEAEVFCTFWLPNVLRATMACTFSSLIWPDGSAPTALASLLFDFPEPQIMGKTQYCAPFLPFRAPAPSFFWFFLFFDLLFCSSLFWLFPPLLLHLSILSEVWLLHYLFTFIQRQG